VLVRQAKVNFYDDKADKPVGIHIFIGRRPATLTAILQCSNG